MTSYSQVCQRWVDRLTGATTLPLLAADRVYPSHGGDAVYSYGSHFVLAQALRDRKGAVRLILLNGDRYSPSTTNHQGHIRRAVQGCEIPSVVVPFTVLESAGIEQASIVVVDKTDDGMRWTWRESQTEPTEWEIENDYARDVRMIERNGERWFRFESQQHVLGESVLRASVSGFGVKPRTAYFLSGFDAQERHLSYFFAELPHKVATLAEAYESLKPLAVRMAEGEGREVKRQGDVYAIPLPSASVRTLRKAGATFGRQAHVLGTNHAATEVATLGNVTLARRTLWHRPEGRNPDHRRVALGSTWHVLVKNTVPVTAGR